MPAQTQISAGKRIGRKSHRRFKNEIGSKEMTLARDISTSGLERIKDTERQVLNAMPNSQKTMPIKASDFLNIVMQDLDFMYKKIFS